MAIHCRLFACYLVLLTFVSTVVGANASMIICYQCSGVSGIANLSLAPVNCGLPFKDSSTAPLPIMQCSGQCVTQVVYSGNATSSIHRSCTDAPITDGCEYGVDGATGRQRWSCIKTCQSDRCNMGSDGTIMATSTIARLAAVIVVVAASFRSID